MLGAFNNKFRGNKPSMIAYLMERKYLKMICNFTFFFFLEWKIFPNKMLKNMKNRPEFLINNPLPNTGGKKRGEKSI